MFCKKRIWRNVVLLEDVLSKLHNIIQSLKARAIKLTKFDIFASLIVCGICSLRFNRSTIYSLSQLLQIKKIRMTYIVKPRKPNFCSFENFLIQQFYWLYIFLGLHLQYIIPLTCTSYKRGALNLYGAFC